MDDEYDVRGLHEDALDKAAEARDDSLAQKMALATAILSTFGALISYASGDAQNEAMFLKNESILKQALASDQWAYYQARSTKAHIAEAAAALATLPALKQHFIAERDKEEQAKTEVQRTAERLQAQSRSLAAASDARLRPHQRLALALSCIQIAIATAAVTVLTRRRWLMWGVGGAALAGLGAALSALFVAH